MRPPKEELDGLFYKDSAKIRNKLKKSPEFWGPMPTIENTGWQPPREFPNLSAAKVIGFDTETYDPELMDAGPGWGRGRGHIVGASIAVEDGTSWYFPMRHGILPSGKQILTPEHAQMNMDPEQVLRFLRHTLDNDKPKVGANVIYDVGWLAWEGVNVGGKIYDVQFAEALLNSEEPDVSLESLGRRYLNEGKDSDEMYHWLGRWNGKAPTSSQRAYLYITPPCLAGPYAEADASLPIRVLNNQWAEMDRRGVLDLFDLECRSVPLLVKMRLKGSPVNINKAEQVHGELSARATALKKQIDETVGTEVSPNSPQSMQKAFNALGIPIPKKLSKTTGEMAVSFDKKLLGSIDHPFVKLVLEHKGLLKVRDTFIQSYIIDKNVNGRLFCTFHPLKSDEGGTRSGRFASSDPNLQNIPVRTEEGKLVRSIFDGTIYGNRWRSFDYSSVEYRLLVHFAVGPGSDEVRALFANDPTLDYHQIVADIINASTNLGIKRGPAKTINFGIVYGMSGPALAGNLGLEMAEAKRLLNTYHEAIPYAKETMNACAGEVDATGMVRTILNRASDFNKWEKKGYDEQGRRSMAYEEACREFGRYNIERSEKHKALNRKLQGSAADVMKMAMVGAYEAGLFADDACGVPSLTVHDELNWEDKGDEDNPAWGEMKRYMENCAAHLLRVPLLVDGGVGPTWREAH